jgi:periplasmic protein TonB
MLMNALRLLGCIIVILLAATVCLAGDSPAVADTLSAFDKAPAPADGAAAHLYHVQYPEAAKKAGIEGKVLLSVLIGADGQTKSVEVVKGVRDDLNKAALDAVRKTRWQPAEKDHHPVAVRVMVPVQFKLEKKAK